MRFLSFTLSLLSFGAQLTKVNAAIAIQAPAASLVQTTLSASRQAQVKATWQASYTAYRRHAKYSDDLLPLSQSAGNSRNGWGATIIDNLDALSPAMFNFSTWYAEGVKFVGTVNFTASATDQSVSVFETTIRYLGGLLSTYNISSSHDTILLNKAKQLGSTLTLAWSQGNVIPYGFLNTTTRTPFIQSTNIAEAGSLLLEFNALSTYGGSSLYRQLAETANAQLRSLPAVFPGLLATGVSPTTNKVVGDLVSFGPASDSFYEYLVKYALLTGNLDPSYLTFWNQAVSSAINHLIKNSTVGNFEYLTDYSASNGGSLYRSSHLACYAGGNWLLGGKMLKNQTIINHGLALIDTCHNTYNKTISGIGPEVFGFVDKATGSTNGWTPSDSDIAFYNASGFATVSGSQYNLLRPEVVESYFYAWRITGNTKYQDWAWDAYQSFITSANVSATDPNQGFASIANVNKKPTPQWDQCQSFWYSETLKFLWLTFSPGTTLSLDDYVFSTEGHPFPIQTKVNSFTVTSAAKFALLSPEMDQQLGIKAASPLNMANPPTLTSFEVEPLPAPSGIPALLSVPGEVLENTIDQSLKKASHGILQQADFKGIKGHSKRYQKTAKKFS